MKPSSKFETSSSTCSTSSISTTPPKSAASTRTGQSTTWLTRPRPPPPTTTTRRSETITPQCATPPGSNLAAFLFTHSRDICNLEQRVAKHRRLIVKRPPPSLIAGPSNWLITLSQGAAQYFVGYSVASPARPKEKAQGVNPGPESTPGVEETSGNYRVNPGSPTRGKRGDSCLNEPLHSGRLST